MSKRTRILVDPQVQWSLAVRVLTHWFLLLSCLFAISLMVRLLIAAGQQSFIDSLKASVSIQAPLFCVMLILMPVFVRDTLKLSNRFAGPMYRLRTVLAELAQGGEGSRIKFRDGDFWSEAASDFNVVYDQLTTLKARNEELEARLKELKGEEVTA
ncbi:MAG: hypothetical protein HKN47_06035 [Pirellulaceae bacterium]|nr:hypothetical protein [Pirellulaceae bacterium]